MRTHPVVPPTGEVTVYLTSWCPYCALLRQGLEREGIAWTGIDVETDEDAEAAAAAVETINGGNRVVPTVVFPDGTTATNPDIEDVRLRLAR